MKRRDALKTLGALGGAMTIARYLPGCADEEPESSTESLLSGHDSNYARISSDASWRTTWTHIVPGELSISGFSGLLFHEGSTGFVAIYATDGQGRLVNPPLAQYTTIGNRNTWTHVVPGHFGPSGYTGFLFFDKTHGHAEFYDSDGHGNLNLLRSYDGWRTSWTHIVPGMFKPACVWNQVATSETYTGLLFYSQSEGDGEIWTTDGTGTISLFKHYSGWRTSWTHIVAADFWDSGNNDQFTDVFFYCASDPTTGRPYGEMYRSVYFTPDGTCNTASPLELISTHDDLPANVTNIVAGNFGGTGRADLAFHMKSTGAVSIRTFDGEANVVLRELERLDCGRTSVDLVVPGNFQMDDPEDYRFFEGDKQTNEELRNWRAAAGGFADFLFYDRAAGLGEVYLHAPLPPPLEPLAGYITSATSHGTQQVSTGSVVPGETISFHISSKDPNPYSIAIYRAADVGGTALAQIPGPTVVPPPGGITRTAYKDGCGWDRVGDPFPIPSWASGLYIARVTGSGTHIDLPFVVRAATPASQSRILFVIADATYEAYNDFGGRSVYGYQNPVNTGGAPWPQSGTRAPFAFHVSFDRAHAGRYDTTDAKWTRWEVPFIRWLDQQGIAVEVCTARDLHLQPPSASYRLIVFVGHHEYWSAAMRGAIEAFASAGGNVAFLCGNTCWWQVRFSADGTQMTCYKIASFDGYYGTANADQTTANWYDYPVCRPETSLTGVSYFDSAINFYGEDTPRSFVTSAAAHWIFSSTGLANGSPFGTYVVGAETRSVLGSEVDRAHSSTPTHTLCGSPYMSSPNGFARLASVNDGAKEVGTVGIFSPNSGASWVFAAPTMNWSLGLSDNGTPAWGPVDQITLNVLFGLRGSFRQIAGQGNDIAIGADGTVWLITNTVGNGGFTIQRWTGSTWTTIGGAAVRVAVDPQGRAWVINNVNGIFQWSGSTWISIPGNGRDVGIGANGDVWVVGGAPVAGGYGIYKWSGSSWISVSGGATRIAVDPAGNPWTVDSSNVIRRRIGGVSGSWQVMPGLATDVGVGPDGSVWVVGTSTQTGDPGPSGGYQIWWWAGTHWARVPGSASNISVGPSGSVWVVTSTHGVWRWT
jgi:N,N-dimethylformamidase beta subunit-like, C-terminal/Tectonin domain